MKAIADHGLTLNKLMLMQNTLTGDFSLKDLVDQFPAQLGSLQEFGLSSGPGAEFAFDPDSIKLSATACKQLTTLRLKTRVLPDDVVWHGLMRLSTQEKRVLTILSPSCVSIQT